MAATSTGAGAAPDDVGAAGVGEAGVVPDALELLGVGLGAAEVDGGGDAGGADDAGPPAIGGVGVVSDAGVGLGWLP